MLYTLTQEAAHASPRIRERRHSHVSQRGVEEAQRYSQSYGIEMVIIMKSLSMCRYFDVETNIPKPEGVFWPWEV